ncbi:serine/threonine-protein kinase [Marinactinospora rubrisoli]|uniref:Protein kinase n=1 Tax=Marinactinospora rubrisoli TaxID=2715399 RepID=A0ABW2KFE7_9ACTN
MKPGVKINQRYELQCRAGKGGMGVVWKAWDLTLARPVAVKVYAPTDDYQPADILARFRLEAQSTAHLSHAGLPAIYDVGEDGRSGNYFLVMEFVEGLTLREYLKKNWPFDVSVAVAIAGQFASALAMAHDVPVVHRDLKPENIMLSNDGFLKVMDFGIASVLRPDVPRPESTREEWGTAGYKAPEHIERGAKEPSSDVYAMGCILYEMLAGRGVFSEQPVTETTAEEGKETLYLLQQRHMKERPRPVRELRPAVPQWLDDLTLRLLEKDPGDRPATAREVFGLLAPHLPAPGDRLTGAPPPDCRWPFVHPGAPPVPKQTPDTSWVRPAPSVERGLNARSRADFRKAAEHARSVAAAGRTQEAERVLAEAVAEAGRRFGPVDRSLVVDLRIEHAEMLVGMGRTAEGTAAYRQLLDELTRTSRRGDQLVRKVADRWNELRNS